MSSTFFRILVGKKSKNVFDLFSYPIEKYGFPLSYVEVVERLRANEPLNGINSVTKVNNSLSNGEN